MIRRPNVRARVYRLNVQIAHRANYRYGWRVQGRYFKPCRWCRRPNTDRVNRRYPGLCGDCKWYLVDLENDHHIPAQPPTPVFEGYEPPKRVLQVPPFTDQLHADGKS